METPTSKTGKQRKDLRGLAIEKIMREEVDKAVLELEKSQQQKVKESVAGSLADGTVLPEENKDVQVGGTQETQKEEETPSVEQSEVEFTEKEKKALAIYGEDAKEMISHIHNVDYEGLGYETKDIQALIDMNIKRFWNKFKEEVKGEGFVAESKLDAFMVLVNQQANKNRIMGSGEVDRLLMGVAADKNQEK